MWPDVPYTSVPLFNEKFILILKTTLLICDLTCHTRRFYLSMKSPFWFRKKYYWYLTWRAIHVGSTFKWKFHFDFENDIADMWLDVPYTSFLLFNQKSILILITILLIWDLTCHTRRLYFSMKSPFWFRKRYYWCGTGRAIHVGSTFQWKAHSDFGFFNFSSVFV